MESIRKTVGALGLLSSVMALCSIVYGAFQEPLGPYMQGIMGGVMDVYRTIRDVMIGGLGWVLAGLINWIRSYFSFLPPAPWVHLPGWSKDTLAIYFLGMGAWHRLSNRPENKGNWPPLIEFFGNIFWFVLVGLRILLVFQGRGRPADGKGTDWASGLFYWLRQIIYTVVGASLYFLFVYAENRIGL